MDASTATLSHFTPFASFNPRSNLSPLFSSATSMLPHFSSVTAEQLEVWDNNYPIEGVEIENKENELPSNNLPLPLSTTPAEFEHTVSNESVIDLTHTSNVDPEEETFGLSSGDNEINENTNNRYESFSVSTTPVCSPEPVTIPSIMLEFRSDFYCLFSKPPSMDVEENDICFLNGQVLFYGKLTDLIQKIKSLFGISNDVVIEFPDLKLSFNEHATHTKIFTPYHLHIMHSALLKHMNKPNQALKMLLLESSTSFTSQLQFLKSLLPDTHELPDMEGRDNSVDGVDFEEVVISDDDDQEGYQNEADHMEYVEDEHEMNSEEQDYEQEYLEYTVSDNEEDYEEKADSVENDEFPTQEHDQSKGNLVDDEFYVVDESEPENSYHDQVSDLNGVVVGSETADVVTDSSAALVSAISEDLNSNEQDDLYYVVEEPETGEPREEEFQADFDEPVFVDSSDHEHSHSKLNLNFDSEEHVEDVVFESLNESSEILPAEEVSWHPEETEISRSEEFEFIETEVDVVEKSRKHNEIHNNEEDMNSDQRFGETYECLILDREEPTQTKSGSHSFEVTLDTTVLDQPSLHSESYKVLEVSESEINVSNEDALRRALEQNENLLRTLNAEDEEENIIEGLVEDSTQTNEQSNVVFSDDEDTHGKRKWDSGQEELEGVKKVKV